jgi:hypothetical protein
MGLRGINAHSLAARRGSGLSPTPPQPPNHPPLTRAQEMELWLGPSHHGSTFATRTELRWAWLTHGDRIMAMHASPGKRPMAWWEFEAGDLQFNADRERSTLYDTGILGEEERRELLAYWRQQFERAWSAGFVLHTGGRVLKGASARRAHYAWADIPAELVNEWTSQRLRRGKTIRKPKATAVSPMEPAEPAEAHEAAGAAVEGQSQYSRLG